MENDKNAAIQAIVSMIERSEKAQVKFKQGTSQYTLQKNRIKALYIALALVEKELDTSDKTVDFTKYDFEKALAPITSLISKSEKAQKKLAQGTWQHSMLENNLKALHIALPLLKNTLSNYDKNRA